MNRIDPNSPRQAGLDSNGQPVKLGERDSEGYFVGWIDENGLAWESRRFRDEAVGCGRLLDAFIAWNSTGGLGKRPDPVAIFREHNVLEKHWRGTIRDFDRSLMMYRLNALNRARMAQLN